MLLAAKTEEEEEDEMVVLLDPTQFFTNDILVHILKLLPPAQLMKCAVVSRSWRTAANLDDIWEIKCQERWNCSSTETSPSKVYIPAASQQYLSWKQKYMKAEAERRASSSCVTLAELTTFTWKFRFKHSAGVWFVANDPYWVHNKDESKMMRRKFTIDGKFTSVTNLSETTDPFFEDDGEPMVWRFTGAGDVNVQVNEYPPLTVRRTPDWGFVLENQWVKLIADLTVDGPFRYGL